MKNVTSISLKFCFGLTLLLAWSCNKDNNVKRTSPETAQKEAEVTAHDNSQLLIASQDVMDITSAAMVERGIDGGRYASDAKVEHDHWECQPSISGTFDIDRSHADSLVYQGSITIDYGDGSTCQDSASVRKGKITDAFVFVFGHSAFDLTETISFDAFQKDSVQFDGAFITRSTSRKLSTLEFQNAKITYADGTSTAWNGNLTVAYDRSDNNWGDGPFSNRSITKKITGDVTGTTRGGLAFSAAITKEVLFRYACSRKFPVSGTVKITVDNMISTVDYGEGSCDRTYSVTSDSTITTHNFVWGHH